MGTWGRTLTSLSCCHPGCEHHQRDLPPPYHYRRTANACEDGWRWKSTLPQARLVTRRWLVCATSQLEVEHHDLRGRHCGVCTYCLERVSKQGAQIQDAGANWFLSQSELEQANT